MDIDLSTFSFKSDFYTITLPMFMMVVDIVTGFLNAWKKKQVKSSVMRTGLAKKMGEICVILIGVALVKGTTAPHYILAGLSFYIILMEAVSVAENLDKLGVPIPKWFKKAIGTLKDTIQNGTPIKGDDNNENDTRSRKKKS
jgi:toxin secretion/phage lysis holin